MPAHFVHLDIQLDGGGMVETVLAGHGLLIVANAGIGKGRSGNGGQAVNLESTGATRPVFGVL